MPRTRKNHPPSLKAKVAVEAIKAHKTTTQIAQMFGVHPTQVGGWKKQALAGLPDVFGNGRQQVRQQADAEKDELYKQIGQLKVGSRLSLATRRSGLKLERRQSASLTEGRLRIFVLETLLARSLNKRTACHAASDGDFPFWFVRCCLHRLLPIPAYRSAGAGDSFCARFRYGGLVPAQRPEGKENSNRIVRRCCVTSLDRRWLVFSERGAGSVGGSPPSDRCCRDAIRN